MLKTLAAVAGATALAGTGITLAAAPAHAAAHPAGSIFLHGTSRQAHFWSRSDCESHAKWEVGQVTKASATATLLPGTQDSDFQGPELRFNCYPVRGAQWTYLTAYTSKTGNPVASTDIYVDTSNRLSDLLNGVKTVDSENVWSYEHSVSKRASSTDVATCDKYLNYFVNLVKVNPHARTVAADTACEVDNGIISYYVDYAATTATAGLLSDQPLPTSEAPQPQPMLDALGYDYPLAQDAHQAHTHAWRVRH
ncbi:hypothetical protein [Allobranchiibius sp. GilTou38]|uniref:hypothetical protein n=1 Tax=Allobranchiibius sp. GilTou38 TaxID=2815210 RepID=UPI001AA10EB2|nr:hypothetical protein [Allobranchiibius sp. GilTou38]MBO1766002.1 hypothetical protein [Allobranchiibius sp. GilTou38]